MKVDEIKHAEMANHYGAAELPLPVKQAMQISSKVMTTAAYYI
jgi:ubiquinone biosynthesis monooxygenase Coq7